MKQLTSYIETMLDEVFIMSEYTGISTSKIEDYVITENSFRNPLRVDRRPSAQFKYTDKLRLIDYGKNEYSGDIYHVVGMTLGLNSNNSQHFVTICNTIIKDLIRNRAKLSTFVPTSLKINELTHEASLKRFTRITVEYDKWTNDTFRYWYKIVAPNKRLGKILLVELHRYGIHPIKKFWLKNNKRATKVSNMLYPIYAYLLKIDADGRHYKIYLPDQSPKFYTNGSETFNYTDKLPSTRIGVIVKSIKDAVVMNSIAIYLRIQDQIAFIPISSETATLSYVEIAKLRQKHTHLAMMYDWDTAGFNNAYINAVKHELQPIFITNLDFDPYQANLEEVTMLHDLIHKHTGKTLDLVDYRNFADLFTIKDNQAKDFTDYAIKHGIDKTIKLFIIYLDALTNGYERQEEETRTREHFTNYI